jgi:lysyl-tRNA synthetase class 2
VFLFAEYAGFWYDNSEFNRIFLAMGRLTEENQTRIRRKEQAQNEGINPFPARVKRTHTIAQALVQFDVLAKKESELTLVGRLKTIRLHGGSCFANIEDGTENIQIFIKKDLLGEKPYEQFNSLFDMGDFVEATGTPFTTKRGEKSLLLTHIRLISKALLPLPEKWHGLSDVEIRYRKRYLDLIANPGVKETFVKRAKIITTIRSFLDQAGFLEVETPILQPIPGGANAAPFITHHNALNTDLYLRIAPELYLKRLIVGGLEKVYEISRCFRNEGIDKSHNPEFTQVEFYAAYWDYRQLMDFTEKLIKEIVNKVNGSMKLTFAGVDVDFTGDFARVTFMDACHLLAKIDVAKLSDKELVKISRERGLDIPSNMSRAKILDEIFKTLVRPHLSVPTFITDHPVELSPLAKKREDNPRVVERFQLVAAGAELCNAFSELNDPIDQAERFKTQEKMRKAGDEEAQRIDTDYIEALSYGMPPTAGIGIGIDRLTSILTNSRHIKEVILFPTLKPKESSDEQD